MDIFKNNVSHRMLALAIYCLCFVSLHLKATSDPEFDARLKGHYRSEHGQIDTSESERLDSHTDIDIDLSADSSTDLNADANEDSDSSADSHSNREAAINVVAMDVDEDIGDWDAFMEENAPINIDLHTDSGADPGTSSSNAGANEEDTDTDLGISMAEDIDIRNLGYSVKILRGKNSMASFKSAKIFASNFKQTGVLVSHFRKRYNQDISLSFFAPQGFQLALNYNYQSFINNLNRTGHWKISPFEDTTNFNIDPLVVRELDTLLITRALGKIYSNEQTRPQYDSIVILGSTPNTSYGKVTLERLISRLKDLGFEYSDLDVFSSRVNYHESHFPSYLDNRIAGESLDYNQYKIQYHINHGFVGHPNSTTAQQRISIDILKWWENIKTKVSKPTDFSYQDKKMLYASLANSKDLKNYFFQKSSNNESLGINFFDNELTPRIQPIFDAFLEEFPNYDESKYQEFIKSIRPAFPPNAERRIRIIFFDRDSESIAKRIAIKNPNKTYMFQVDENGSKIHWAYLTELKEKMFWESSLQNEIKKYVFNKNYHKRFVFLNAKIDADYSNSHYNYQQEQAAANILNTMIEKYQVYPTEIEFINYFDSSEREYEPRYFEQALTRMSQKEPHKTHWQETIQTFRGSSILEIITDHEPTDLITPLGTKLNVDINASSQRVARIKQPASMWNFFRIAPDKLDNTTHVIRHFKNYFTIDSGWQNVLRNFYRYKDLMTSEDGPKELLKAEYQLHLESMLNSINLSLPLDKKGILARKELWDHVNSKLAQWDTRNSVTHLLLAPETIINQVSATMAVNPIEIKLEQYPLLALGDPVPISREILQPGDGSEKITMSDLNEYRTLRNAQKRTRLENMESLVPRMAAATLCRRSASISEGNTSAKRRRFKRSVSERCTPDEIDNFLEEHQQAIEEANRWIADYQQAHNQLISRATSTTPNVQDASTQTNSTTKINDTKSLLEPIIDSEGEVRLLSYRNGKISVSDPIPNVSQAEKNSIQDFNQQLEETYKAPGNSHTLSINHFWLAYAAANYAKHGISTDLRSLLNAAVFVPNLLLETTKLPVSLVHQLKTSRFLADTLGFNSKNLTHAIERLETRLQPLKPAAYRLGKGLGRFGAGVMLYNFVDDFLQRPNFATASTEEKTLWSLNTVTDGVFATESAVSLVEEFTLFALPGAELLGPLGLGLFAITEAVELAYKEQHLHQTLAAENHWLQVERDHYLKTACKQVQHQQQNLLDCAQTITPITALRLNSGQAHWVDGELRLSKTILHGQTKAAGAEPIEDSSWNRSENIISTFKKMSLNAVEFPETHLRKTRLQHPAQIVIMPGTPNKQVHYRFQDQGLELSDIRLSLTSIVGDDNKDFVRDACLKNYFSNEGDVKLKAFWLLRLSPDPEQLAYCLELLTDHNFCPTVRQIWFGGSGTCQVGFMGYDYASATRAAVGYHYQYMPTDVSIGLDDNRSYVLVTPKLAPPPTKKPEKPKTEDQNRFGKVTYHIQGNGQTNTLLMQAGFDYQIQAQSEQENWLLVAPEDGEFIAVEGPRHSTQSNKQKQICIEVVSRSGSTVSSPSPMANLCLVGDFTPQLHLSYAQTASE